MKNLWVLLLPLLLIFNSCKMMKNAENASVNSEKAANTTEPLAYMSVSGGSEDAVARAIEDVKNAKSFDLKARTMGSFIKSMYNQVSFQVANTRFLNYNAFYEAKLIDDMKTLRRLATEFMPKSGKYNVTNVKGNDGNIKALAAALHLKNPWCEHAHSQIRPMACRSMLDIIHDGFKAIYVDKIPESKLPVYYKVLTRKSGEEAFLYLLELRVKFLPLIGIAHVSHLHKNLYSKLKMVLFDWSPDFYGSSPIKEAAFKGTREITELENESDDIRRELQKVDYEIVRLENNQLTEQELEEESSKIKNLRAEIAIVSGKLNVVETQIWQNQMSTINEVETAQLVDLAVDEKLLKAQSKSQNELKSINKKLEQKQVKLEELESQERRPRKVTKLKEQIAELKIEKLNTEHELSLFKHKINNPGKGFKLSEDLSAEANELEKEYSELSKQLVDKNEKLKEEVYSQYEVILKNRKKESQKLQSKLAKLRIDLNKQEDQNQENVEKAKVKIQKTQKKKRGDIDPSEADIDYFGLVKNYVVTEREFLRSLKVKDGYGRYVVERPLRYAELPGIVLKLLRNLNMEELKSVPEMEFEKIGINYQELGEFEDSIQNLISNSDYKE